MNEMNISKLSMRWLGILFCIYFLTLCFTCGKWPSWKNQLDTKDADTYKYHVDYLLLAMEWPEGLCEYINSTHKHVCAFSDHVSGWVLHGLWPSHYAHKYLVYCNRSMKFDFHKIEGMLGELKKYWPNLYIDTSTDQLWKHEYEKHGTCAAKLDGFETEKDYFTKAIELLQNHNPGKALESKGIFPSKEAFESDTIIEVFTQVFGNRVCTQCSHYNGNQVLSGLAICLTTDLEVRDCPRCGGSHNCSGPLYYHPPQFKI